MSLEAVPARLMERSDLERASAAFREVYDWPTTVLGSGGPPFRAHDLTSLRAHAFPTNDQIEPTRFTF